MLEEKYKNKNVLIVDDYESMLDLVEASLRELGLNNITKASSGNQAIKLIQANHGTSEQFDLILSDYSMEDGTGLDLLNFVKKDERFKKTAFIIVTSKSDVSLVLECLSLGLDNYIVKPWANSALAQKITKAFKARSPA